MNPPLFRQVDCISLSVDDLDSALAFYEKDLGHELVWRDATAAGMCLPGSEAELVVHTDDIPIETDLTVESVPDAVSVFVGTGGRVLAGPFEIRIGLCAVVSDPWDNHLIILDQSKGLLTVDSEKSVIGNVAPPE
jgi:lactoylglutathione lyase